MSHFFTVLRANCAGNALSPYILLFHIADDRLPTIVHMYVLDADKLLPAITQASKDSRTPPFPLGPAAPEVGDTIARARALAEQLDRCAALH